MHPTRTLGALSAALAAAVLFAGAPAGHAGPDDGKVVTTEAHVDAPKTYWEDGHFVLKNEAHMTAVPLDGTVNWIGRGYSTLLRPEQKFMFTVPDDPAFAPLSDHGRRWYAAPHIAGDHNTPIWAGFGADDKIPADTFRDGSFSLDVVGFSGPGRMEAFNAWDHSLNRLLSSHDPSYRATTRTTSPPSPSPVATSSTTGRPLEVRTDVSSPRRPRPWCGRSAVLARPIRRRRRSRTASPQRTRASRALRTPSP